MTLVYVSTKTNEEQVFVCARLRVVCPTTMLITFVDGLRFLSASYVSLSLSLSFLMYIRVHIYACVSNLSQFVQCGEQNASCEPRRIDASH